jgi:hypothetical protein
MTSARAHPICVLDFQQLTNLTDLSEALDVALRVARLTYLAAAGAVYYQDEIAGPEDEDGPLIRELADATEQTVRHVKELYAKSVTGPPAPAPSEEDLGVIPLRRPHDATADPEARERRT